MWLRIADAMWLRIADKLFFDDSHLCQDFVSSGANFWSAMKKKCSCLTKRPKFERFTLDRWNLRQKVIEAIMKRASGLVAKSNVAIVGPRVRFPAGAAQCSIMLNFSVKKGFRYLNF